MPSAIRLSISANIVLTGIVALLLWRGQPADRSSFAGSARASSARSGPPEAAQLANDLQSKPAGSVLTPNAVAQLERAGVSRHILTTALVEDFNLRWDKRILEMERQYAPRQMPERERVEMGRLREAEQIRELKEALGEEGYRVWDKEQTLRSFNSSGLPMTAEEAEQAYRLQKEFNLQHKEAQMAMEDGFADTADASALQMQAQAELDRELEKLFGKQRLDKMRGFADTNPDVNSKYAELNPTPGQARAAVRTEEEFHAREVALTRRLKENPEAAANAVAELKALEDAREENLRQIFGAGVYDTMKQQSDPTYKTLKQYAEAWELKDHEIQSVYESLHAYQDQAERMRHAATLRESAGQPVNWHEISSSIEHVQQQTEASLQNIIGSERLRRLKLNGILTTK